MPNIPLADIPNAPRIATGAPDTSANMGALQGTIARFVQNNEQRQISTDFGQSQLQALQSVGQSVQGAASVASELALHEAKAKTEYQIADARTAWDSSYDAFTSGIRPGDDPDQLRKSWAEKKKEIIGQVMSNPDLSPAAKQRLQIEAMRFDRVSSVQIDSHAAKLTFERAKVSLQNRAESLLESGNPEGAKAIYREMANQKLIYPEQLTALEQDTGRKHELLTISKQIDADPKAARDHIASLVDEQGQARNTALSVDQLEKLKDSAARSLNQRKSAIADQISHMAKANLIHSKEQIMELGQGYLDDVDIAVLDMQRQKDQPPDWQSYSDVLTRVQSYDPSKDTDGSQHYSILRDINSLPDGWRDKIRKDFSEAQSPNTELRSIYTSRIDGLMKMGFFGDASTDKDGEPKNADAFNRAQETRAKFLFKLHEFSKQNPQAAPEQFAKWFKDNSLQYKYVAPDNGSRWYNPLSWGGKKEPQHVASYNDIASKGLITSGGKPLATGTIFGYPSDPYKDSNSLARIGSFTRPTKPETKLKEGDVAISPDIEKRFVESGIKPLDMVKITFSDGSTETVRWADRTMQDAQAVQKFGKPLRGRIDFFAPEGAHPHKDKKIVSFEKAQ